MSNAAQDSQQKSANLKVYAFEVARINAATVSLKLRLLGGVSSVRTIAISEIPNILSQIDSALADGVDKIEINIGSGVCTISPALLKNLKTSLSSYHAVSGGSGAQVVRKGVSTPLKSKAPARTVSSAARKNLISQKDTRANSDVELENTAHTARVSADFENKVARIVGEELRKAVMPLFAEIDAIAALARECAAELSAVSKDFITCASGKLGGRNTPPAPRRKGGRESCCPKAGRVNAEGSISTRGGRTSVVVGHRKVS